MTDVIVLLVGGAIGLVLGAVIGALVATVAIANAVEYEVEADLEEIEHQAGCVWPELHMHCSPECAALCEDCEADA